MTCFNVSSRSRESAWDLHACIRMHHIFGRCTGSGSVSPFHRFHLMCYMYRTVRDMIAMGEWDVALRW